MCQPGEFCVAGLGVATKCTAGKFCSDYELSAVSGDCSARHYCLEGATTHAPRDLNTEKGALCT
jgi:hypothetical protein